MTPKQRFISTRQTETWNNIAASKEFMEACEFALLELISKPRESNAYADNARSHQIDGAREVLRILCSLGLKETPKELQQDEPLNYGLNPQPIPVNIKR